MQRIRRFVPGFDCRGGNCQHAHKGDHGAHNDEWHFILVADDGQAAMSLRVFTDMRDSQSDGSKVFGASLDLHRGYPRSPEELLGTDFCGGGHACEYLASHLCYGSDSSALEARALFEAAGDPRAGLEQPVALWEALAVKLAAWDDRSTRLDLTHEKCSCCGGKGIVRRP